MQTDSRPITRDELALAHWRNSGELWRRQCAEPESEGVFEAHEVDPYLLILQCEQNPIPHIGRVERNAEPDIEAFGAMYEAIATSPVQLPLSLRIHPGANEGEWEDFLGNLGFQSSATRQMAMGRSLSDVRPVAESDVEVVQVDASDEIRMAQAMECNGEAFGSPPPQRRFFLNPRTVDVYLALYEGIPAGSATAAYVDKTVGINGVATRPGFRGRGIAGVLVNRILQGASSRAEIAVLDCRQELVSLYQRSGFEVARELPTFILLAARL